MYGKYGTLNFTKEVLKDSIKDYLRTICKKMNVKQNIQIHFFSSQINVYFISCDKKIIYNSLPNLNEFVKMIKMLHIALDKNLNKLLYVKFCPKTSSLHFHYQE